MLDYVRRHDEIGTKVNRKTFGELIFSPDRVDLNDFLWVYLGFVCIELYQSGSIRIVHVE